MLCQIANAVPAAVGEGISRAILIGLVAPSVNEAVIRVDRRRAGVDVSAGARARVAALPGAELTVVTEAVVRNLDAAQDGVAAGNGAFPLVVDDQTIAVAQMGGNGAGRYPDRQIEPRRLFVTVTNIVRGAFAPFLPLNARP